MNGPGRARRHDNTTSLVAPGQVPRALAPLLQGWSARVTADLGAKLASDAIVSAGAECGGIGSDVQIWTFKARANVPLYPSRRFAKGDDKLNFSFAAAAKLIAPAQRRTNPSRADPPPLNAPAMGGG